MTDGGEFPCAATTGCVEVTHLGTHIVVRDSKAPGAGAVVLSSPRG
ncbi:DUF397 domain-containing protein [Actinokineospora soli]|uniref:DUF397 domain-containing protein n=1 Tax=Actinokineospora soli TaxID=1048753 RepID=A0ABW2TJU8_9PSEU